MPKTMPHERKKLSSSSQRVGPQKLFHCEVVTVDVRCSLVDDAEEKRLAISAENFLIGGHCARRHVGFILSGTASSCMFEGCLKSPEMNCFSLTSTTVACLNLTHIHNIAIQHVSWHDPSMKSGHDFLAFVLSDYFTFRLASATVAT
jgi:hypothetical protein